MSHLEASEHIEALIPFVKAFSFTWFNLQAAKRRYQKQHETPMPVEMERVTKEDFMNQRYVDKIKWAVRILAKLRKNIKRESRGDLVKIITEGNVQSPCIMSNADTKNKMRRIDCLRQADKVWRLDVVMIVLFRGVPLESTDGERLSRCDECKNPALCINPYHIVIHVRELEVYLVSFINNAQPPSTNIIPSVFSAGELQHMAISSISEGGSTKEVLGADYLGSMLKMETDDHADAQPVANDQQTDILKMRRSRQSSLSSSSRIAKRRRALNNICSANERDDQNLCDRADNSTDDVYKPKPSSSSSSTCRISSTNYSPTCSTFAYQDDVNTTSKPSVESSQMESATPRPPFSQVGIHNHVSLNLHFNGQKQQQQQQSLPPKTLLSSQSTSDSKLISERFIETLAQRFNDIQQQQRTCFHHHASQYLHQGLQTESTSNTSKTSSKLFSKPITTTRTNILPSREKSITTASNHDTPCVQPQPDEFKDVKSTSNAIHFTSTPDCVLPPCHTFPELRSYLKTIGLDIELVPASNTAPPIEVASQQVRNIDPVQQRISTNEPLQHQICPNTVNFSQTPQQPQIVTLSNSDGKCNRTCFISTPPNALTEKRLEYASRTLALCDSQTPSRSSCPSTQQQQQRRSPSKPPIVFDIANLLSVSNNQATEDRPMIQRVTHQTLLPPPPIPLPLPLPPPSSTSTAVYQHLISTDKVSMMVECNLISDDIHLHDREVEEYMNMVASSCPSKQQSGSASNSNDSNVSSTSSSSSSTDHSTSTNNNNNNNNHYPHHQANVTLTNSVDKTKKNSTLSSQDSRNICDVLLTLYEQERTRSTQLQKQIEQVRRQHRSRNSSGQSHSSESQTGLEIPQGPTNGNTDSTRMSTPAAWISTSGKEKTSVHIQQGHHQKLKFDSTTSINGALPELQDWSPPDPNKGGLNPTKVVQFSQAIDSAQNLIPRPVPMLATNDGLVRHTSSSSSHVATPTGSSSSSNNGVLYTSGNRIFQSPLGQAFAALSPALSPFLSPSTSRACTPSELIIIPADLLNVLNSRYWSEDELLQAFANHLDSGGV